MGRPLIRLLATALAACAVGTAAAQSGTTESVRADLQRDRQEIISKILELTEGEEQAFWPVYREYRMEMARAGDRLVNLLQEYDKKYEILTDADATRLLDEYLSIQSMELSTRKKYLGKFRKVLPPKKVGRFYQVENKMDVAIRYELSGLVPLAK